MHPYTLSSVIGCVELASKRATAVKGQAFLAELGLNHRKNLFEFR